MAAKKTATDYALMMRVSRGRESAFEALHERYARQVATFFYGLTRNTHTASDLCQETFMRLWRARKEYRPTGGFRAYLFGIARNVWREFAKREGRNPALTLPDWDEQAWLSVVDALQRTPHEAASGAETEQRIFEALDQLPDDQRMAFVLRTVEGLSLSEIAEVMDCPENTVRSRRLAAVRKLREALKGLFVS